MDKPYLVVDLEATCDQHHAIPREQTEIIEIGALLVERDTLAPLAEFQTFVRPVLHPTLTPFCTELTSITQADVAHAPRFRQALAQLERWLPGPVTLASWGAYDHRQLRREGQRHRMRMPWGDDHYDIKQAFAQRTGRRMGVRGALRRVGLSFQGTPHRGIDDARNIVRLLPHALGVAAMPEPARGRDRRSARGRDRRSNRAR